MGKKKKINPRNIPATQEDVDRAWMRGVHDGVRNSSAIFLTVLCDKFNGGAYIKDVWAAIEKLSTEVAEHRVSVKDLEKVLDDEYGIIC